MDPKKVILTINVGSSSIKFELVEAGHNKTQAVIRGQIKNIGQHQSVFKVWKGTDSAAEENPLLQSTEVALHYLGEWMRRNVSFSIGCICHRIVHGGPKHFQPEIVTPALLQDLRRHIAFAPGHLPNSLKAVESMQQFFPSAAQVVCFDTAFHAHMPQLAKTIPLPRNAETKDIRKYGFHGLSYEYIYDQLEQQDPDILQKKIIIAHLGSGASMVAIRRGQSIDTTMGFTPAGGFMMSSRTGDIDPGVLLYLMEQKGYSAHQLNELVNHQSGLLGVSGTSADMQLLLEQQTTDIQAKLAIELFCYQAKKHLGALIAVLGGLDILVFTGGIGEAGPYIRHLICSDMEFAGIKLNTQLNDKNETIISLAEQPVTVKVIATSEERMMVRHAIELMNKK